MDKAKHNILICICNTSNSNDTAELKFVNDASVSYGYSIYPNIKQEY